MADSNGDGIDDQTGRPVSGSGGSSTAAAYQQELNAGDGGGTVTVNDAPIIPLWKVRPPAEAPKPQAGNVNPVWVTGSPGAGGDYSTMDAAEMYWQDMSEADRMEFAKNAQKAGMWKPSLGADALFASWAKAVTLAGKYNTLHQDDKSKWMSPFEAVTKMAISGMADDDQSHDGFSTETVVQQFNVSQLTQQAKQILQNELGRNPTDSEMKAYTAAVNAAARANPQTRSTQQEIGPDGMPVPGGDTASVMAGGVDPNQVIQDMAQGTQESDAYKTAAMYLPALRQVIEGSIHL